MRFPCHWLLRGLAWLGVMTAVKFASSLLFFKPSWYLRQQPRNKIGRAGVIVVSYTLQVFHFSTFRGTIAEMSFGGPSRIPRRFVGTSPLSVFATVESLQIFNRPASHHRDHFRVQTHVVLTMPIESKVVNDTDNIVHCSIQDTPEPGNNPAYDEALAVTGVVLAALAVLAVLPSGPFAAGGMLASKGVSVALKMFKSTKVAVAEGSVGGVAAVWGAVRTFGGPDNITVKETLLNPNGSLSKKTETGNTIRIVRTSIETRATTGGGQAPFLISRSTVIKKTATDTTSVRNLVTSDDDIMFTIELPPPSSGKSYFIYAASLFGFRNLVPPTAVQPETPDETGGIWSVGTEIATASSPSNSWLHQMVGSTAQWTWGDSLTYLEKGLPIKPVGSTVTSRYEIVSLGNTVCLKLTDFVVYTTGGTQRSGDKTLKESYDGNQTETLELIDANDNRLLIRIETILMQLPAGTNGQGYYWAYWVTGGSNNTKKLFAIDNNSNSTYIKREDGGIVYLPAVPKDSMVYPKIIEIPSSSGRSAAGDFSFVPGWALLNMAWQSL
ncbi:hypothetical protein B0H16DRAFT_1697173 [Mycena metata]|uniref:Uncharacterized protein n=1 Tax=Mycena metata TaxID=1033252 RepID=A0AAD7MRZ0_9AGAR|nr:hypothetical protein B0H16DRAFT_1697173 [Mycena metata]